ncbi:coiled-coil domain-containing protein 81-like isoform X3 [Gallus gallus]|uniref:coiled-coil domain-containing protein 81-like isoform X3 n=1 Tax=Gallus gallus TaxID=9031 RepID=UPI001AE52F38|nr:coiled-coil domain-containing protein 81-like isoform X3 [Gallus gallus]
MEGCWTVTISSELVYTFPTLLHLSAEEIVAIWDAVSDYILEQMKLDKGVLVPGLGLFAAVREQFHSKEVAVSVRRPVFQLGHRGAVAAGPPVAHRHHPRRCQD